MVKNFKSSLTLSVVPANPELQTNLLFNKNHQETDISPIDEFSNRLQALNKLSPPPDKFDAVLGQLILLGAIAAVESYLRTLFRKLITTDAVCQEKAYGKDVSFGAALHLSKENLPEAILERISFISENNIYDAIKDLLAIQGQAPAEVRAATADYVRICQLRHCAVHRFGRLGTSNAISLGLSDHKDLLEKPMQLEYRSLQEAIAIASGFVKTLNNHLFNEIISRIPQERWKGTFAKDKKIFTAYLEIFLDSHNQNIKILSPEKHYRDFMNDLSNFVNRA